MHKLVLCYPVKERHLEAFRTHLPEVEVVNAGQEGVSEAILDADLFVGHAKVPVDWNAVVAQGRLKLIQSSAAGLDHCLVPSVIASEIPVCSASGLFANQVAEQTLALLLGVIRRLPTFFRQAERREFVRRPTDDLHQKRVGIVGLGGNGRRIAKLLQPFGIEIRATDYFPVNRPDSVQELWGADSLEDLARTSDVLILALPLNASTKGIVDKSIISAMPEGSYLINVARGPVVNEAHLVDALKAEHLSGCGLDVTEVEPLPADSPLWTMENVLISPHVGAQSSTRVDDSTRFACQNLRRFLDGQKLINVVDKSLGFPKPEDMACNQSGELGIP